MVIWPRGGEIAVPDVGAPVGATVGDRVGTKYEKHEKLEGWRRSNISHIDTNRKGWEGGEERQKKK